MAAQPTALRSAGAGAPPVHAVDAPVVEAPKPAPTQPSERRLARVAAAATAEARPRAAASAAPAGAEVARVLRWTLGIPAGALVASATLYVLGAIWTWGELQEAGLSAPDVLSLVPHSQILGRGAQLFVLALLALPLPLAFTWLLHRIVPESDRPWGMPGGLARLVDDHRRLRRDLDELKGKVLPSGKIVLADDSGLDRRVRRLDVRAKGQRGAHDRRMLLTRGAVIAALVAGVVALSPARLAVAVLGLWLVRRTRLNAVRVALVMLAALVLAVSAERFTAPDPLPDATVRTTQGTLVKGPLVAATDAAWHLKVADQRVKTVPAENIAKSSVYSESRPVRGPLGARLADLLR